MSKIEQTVTNVAASLEKISDDVDNEMYEDAKTRVWSALYEAEHALRDWGDRPSPPTNTDVIAIANLILLEAHRASSEVQL